MRSLLGLPARPASKAAEAPGHTGSRSTKLLGLALLAGVVALCLFAFVFSPPDSRTGPEGTPIGQFDAVRIMYVHVPSAVWGYVGFGICALGSAVYLLKRSAWWDRLAHAGAEIGVVFCGISILTGMIWGRPVWGTWWDWGDVRLVTTLMLSLVYLGYLAVRSLAAAPAARESRSAVLGIVGVVLIPIVNRSVDWWEDRTLHQKSTLEELRIEDLTLFTLVLGFLVGGLAFAWLLIHRFRVAWLDAEAENSEMLAAIEERRSEASTLNGTVAQEVAGTATEAEGTGTGAEGAGTGAEGAGTGATGATGREGTGATGRERQMEASRR